MEKSIDNIVGKISGYWRALGPIGPCAVLFLGGCLLILGFIFNWRWLYPGRYTVRNFSPEIRRALVLVIGIICIICSIVFFIFRDKLYRP
ncbi:MAG: immunity 17 family protein [Treponema sp.]|nr:immunity 17 family protein [Treponema sp.]